MQLQWFLFFVTTIVTSNPATLDDLQLSITQLLELSSVSIDSLIDQPFNHANFQQMAIAISQTIEILSRETLPALRDQLQSCESGSPNTSAAYFHSTDRLLQSASVPDGVTAAIKVAMVRVEKELSLNMTFIQSQISNSFIANSKQVVNLRQKLELELKTNNRKILPQVFPDITVLHNQIIANFSLLSDQIQPQFSNAYQMLANQTCAQETNLLAQITFFNFQLKNNSTNISNFLKSASGSLQLDLINAVTLWENQLPLNQQFSDLENFIYLNFTLVESQIANNSTEMLDFIVENSTNWQDSLLKTFTLLQIDLIYEFDVKYHQLSNLRRQIFENFRSIYNQTSGNFSAVNNFLANKLSYLESKIVSNASSVLSFCNKSNQVLASKMTAAFGRVNSVLGQLSSNVPLTVYNGPNSPVGVYKLFETLMPIDNSYVSNNVLDGSLTYLLVFANQNFSVPPAVIFTVRSPGKTTVQLLFVEAEQITNVSCVVRVFSNTGQNIKANTGYAVEVALYGN